METIPFDTKFDAIYIFDVFMHIRNEEDVIKGLQNCTDHLTDGGVLLWIEPDVKTHYDRFEEDGWGFSKDEMDSYATAAKIKLIDSFGLYKKWVWRKRNQSTVYSAKKYEMWFLLLLEKILKSEVLNVRIYQK